jgi:segregation and condensation protein B
MGLGLTEEVGRIDKPGRPILYGTTPDFLRHFGLNSLDELPAKNDEEE